MRVSLGLLLIALGADAALACGVCLSIRGDAFSLPHPRAIEVAVATRAAIDRGALRVADPGKWDTRQKPSARELLTRWSENRWVDRDVNSSLHLVLVDTSESVSFLIRGGEIVIDARSVDAGDCVVVTTSLTLRALAAGQIQLDDAIGRKLFLVEKDSHVAKMLFEPRSLSRDSR